MIISRREFLRLSALGLGSATLRACGIQPAPATVPAAIPATATAIKAAATMGTAATVAPTAAAVPVGSAPAGGLTGLLSAEILGRPTDQQVTVNVLPSADSQIFFEYGSASGQYTAQTSTISASAGVPVNAVLQGLPPNARTYFRTRARLTGADSFSAGAEHSFVTQRTPRQQLYVYHRRRPAQPRSQFQCRIV